MNYYEFINPYYALVKAENKDEATNLYIEQVAGEEDDFLELLKECNQVTEKYAKEKFEENTDESEEEIQRYFVGSESIVLLIDISLL